MKRILILSDSLALPRSQPELSLFESTWPELLRNKGYQVHQVSIGGATSIDLFRQIEYHKSFYPDCVIVQMGIVDCAPRFMSKPELKIARKIPVIGKAIITAFNKNWIKKLRKLTYVKPNIFDLNIKKIKSSFDCIILFIGIIPATEQYEKKLPGIINNIKIFNRILSQNDVFIAMDGIEEKGLMSDFHHLNNEGHKIIYDRIIAVLDSVLAK